MSARAFTPTVAAPVTVFTPVQGTLLQRTCDCGEHTGGGECDDCKKKRKMPLQRLANDSIAPVVPPSIVHDVLRSPGQPLLPATRAWAEPLFGRDFSGVRVHADAKAADSARSVNSLAYTVGQDVVFGQSRYAPSTPAGQKLLVHELVHATQQSGAAGHSSLQAKLDVSRPTDAAELEAEAIAEQTETRQPAHVNQQTPQFIHRSAREVAGGHRDRGRSGECHRGRDRVSHGIGLRQLGWPGLGAGHRRGTYRPDHAVQTNASSNIDSCGGESPGSSGCKWCKGRMQIGLWRCLRN